MPAVVHGERDLGLMLSTLDVQRREGLYTFVTGEWPELEREAHATVIEAEGETYVVTVDDARRAGAPVEFVAAWLTLSVYSALDAVGLTAAVSSCLADVGIACNMLSGFHHDHLLVPVGRATEAMKVLRALSSH